MTLLLGSLSGCGPTPSEQAEDLFAKAEQAQRDGDLDQAIQLLSQSLDKERTSYAYSFFRAQLYVQQGRIKEAQADCQAGLEIVPGDRDLEWLLAECKKPEPERFQGENAEPPRNSK